MLVSEVSAVMAAGSHLLLLLFLLLLFLLVNARLEVQTLRDLRTEPHQRQRPQPEAFV